MQDKLSLEGALAEATMDIVEEDGKGISQQRRIRIWDKKKVDAGVDAGWTRWWTRAVTAGPR